MKAEELDRLLEERGTFVPQQRAALALQQPQAPARTLVPGGIKDLFEQIETYVGTDVSFEADAARQRTIDARAIRGRLPRFLQTGTWNELALRVKDDRLVTAARNWNWSDGNVMLMGQTGIGKTTAAAMLFRRLLGEAVRLGGIAWQDAESMYWFKAYDLATARKEHQLGRGEAPEVVQACSARLLVIDDLGWENGDVTVITEVLGERHDRCYPTVFTTGRTGDQLGQMYGAAAARRMLEVASRPPVVVDCFPESES
jgi:DNA replication protein DnaC